MADKLPDVHISIVNTNNRELLRKCLGSLVSACDGLEFAATVVDNASDDGSVAMVTTHFPWARVIQNSRRRGFAANHNRAMVPVVEELAARYFLVLNEDVELDPHSVTKMVQFCDAEPSLGACGPVIRGRDGLIQPSNIAYPTVGDQFWHSLRPGGRVPTVTSEGWLNASCLLLSVRALAEVGCFDERFFIFFEDTDLGRRLDGQGYRSAICPDATVLHYGHMTVSAPALGSAMERQMARSRYLYFAKHEGPVKGFVVASLVRVALLARAAKALLTGAGRRDARGQGNFGLLISLVRYDPRKALPHEMQG